ncbi:hypothetical protein DPEC_G00220380 [Dallia pectoralis]|uniref:Uncharacterized protein n=1 Tax=Dallia pectoralis TaxID=75939 RepID=A0ACC2G415_DALPE|nr:hypothetical protein DPEC_G00220380 [Dallia pectoralis]
MDQLTWPEINQRLGCKCPDFLQLVDVLLCIPASTADCERGVNLMKKGKSVWRLDLRPDTLSDLLTVQLSSPDIEHFDPDSAIQVCSQQSKEARFNGKWKESR